jgi:predicted TIM-barrel fold metal-dependent hydrolase
MQHCIEQFGPRRCIFKSVLYNAFKRLSQGYSPAERAALIHDTAARVSRLAV